MANITLEQIVRTALTVRHEHIRCQELAEFLRHEASWINMETTAYQLRNHLNNWRTALAEYDRLSKEYEFDTPDEVFTLHNLNKMVDDYRHAR